MAHSDYSTHIDLYTVLCFSVVKRVLQKQHKPADIALRVDAFHPAFGICPYNYDPSQPLNTVPEPFRYSTRSSFIWKFFSSQPSALELLNDIGARFGFEILANKSSDLELFVSYKESNDETTSDRMVWKQRCIKELDQICETIKTERIATVSYCYDEALADVRRIISEQNDVILDVDENQSLIIITGWEPKVRSISEKLKGCLTKLEDDLMHQSKSIEEKLKLDSFVVTMIRAKQYQEQLKNNLPRLKVEFFPGGLRLTGLPDEIKSAKLYIYENVVAQIQSVVCQCSVAKVEFLQKKKVKGFIISEFQKVNIIAVLETKDSQLKLHAMTQKELQSAQDIIQKAIIEKVISLQNENLPVLKDPGWNSLKNKFAKDFDDVFILDEDIQNQRIQLVVTYDKCDILLEEIHNFLVENTVIQQQIDVEQPVIELIRMFYQDEIKKIEKNFARYMLSIGVTGQSFVVRGTEMGLKPALQALQDLCDKVVSEDHVISRPGMEKFFNSEKGKEAIRSLQKTNKVICVEQRYIKSVAQNEQSYGPEASSRILYTGQISGGPIVKVFVGDITKHRVDAIVNAANEKLEHIGGLAAAIVTAGKKGSSLAFISQSCHVPCMYSNSSKLSLCSLQAVSLSYMMSVYVSVLFFCLCKLSTSNY